MLLSLAAPLHDLSLQRQGKDIVLKEVPVPELEENEVLIRVKAVGMGPSDLRG